MNELSHWKNQQMNLLREEMDRLFRRWWSTFLPGGFTEAVPSVDVVDALEEVVLKAEVPGFRPQDLEVTVSENEVSIRGIRSFGTADETQGGVIEKGHEAFSRTVALPSRVDVERVKAYYDSGVLLLRMPRKSSPARRLIPIVTK